MNEMSCLDFREGLRRLVAASSEHLIGLSRGTLHFEHCRGYFRVGPRQIEGETIRCLQIALVETPERYRGRGSFHRMLDAIAEETPLPIFVELVHNQRLEKTLLDMGYEVVARDLGGTPSLFWRR